MEAIKKYLPYIAIVLLILLIFSIVQNFEKESEIKALNASYDALNAKHEEIKESNFNAIDSLESVIDERKNTYNLLDADFLSLEDEEADINKRIDENKKIIIGINDADSLQRIISRRYD